MSLLPFGLMLFVAAMVIIWCVVEALRSDGGDDPGPEGGGPGWGRRPPPTSPPDTPVCWDEFERQFAEYVDALGAVDASSRARDHGHEAPRPRVHHPAYRVIRP